MSVLIVAATILLLWLVFWSIFKVNSYCAYKYDYRPFGSRMLLLIAVPAACLAAIVAIMYFGASGAAGPSPDALRNVYALIVIGLTALLVAFIRVWARTTFLVALFAAFADCVLVVFFFLVMLFALLKWGGFAGKRKA